MALAIYYVVCSLGWVAAAALCYALWKVIARLRHQTDHDRRAIILLLVLTSAVVGVNYVLAYPVALSRFPAAGYSELLDLFVPAEWLYDHTPLRGVMQAVGETLGVGDTLAQNSHSRLHNLYWGTTSPAVYAAGWLVLGGGIVGGAVWLVARIERLVRRA